MERNNGRMRLGLTEADTMFLYVGISCMIILGGLARTSSYHFCSVSVFGFEPACTFFVLFLFYVGTLKLKVGGGLELAMRILF